MARPFFRRRKSCPFSGTDAPKIDYKDVRLLQGFVSERGKIVPSRITAVSVLGIEIAKIRRIVKTVNLLQRNCLKYRLSFGSSGLRWLLGALSCWHRLEILTE